MDLTVSTFFHYYMFEPTRAEKPAERLLAMITSVALGILSLGIAHLICYYAFFNRSIVKIDEFQEEQVVVDSVYRRIIDMEMDASISASSWEQFSDDEVADDPFIEQDIQDALVEEIDLPSEGESVHVRFQTAEEPVKETKKLFDEGTVHEYPVKDNALTPAFKDKGKREEVELSLDGQRVLPHRRESRLVRYLSERRLKRTKSEKMGKTVEKQGKLKRSFSLKNVFHALKHKK